LIKTIQLETADDHLFSKSTPLLAAASELAYHTVHCSALNAEELRRERGLEVSDNANLLIISDYCTGCSGYCFASYLANIQFESSQED
jgi:hypothetical protein